MRQIVLVVHNVRSAHNVGSILRTADGLGIKEVHLTGYTPYPAAPGDQRLPHLAAKINRRIHKTALGAEKSVKWYYRQDILTIITELKSQGYKIVALEQTAESIPLHEFQPSDKVALLVGSEIGGLEKHALDTADTKVEIPMRGSKESFNVAVAAAIALHHLSHIT